MSNRNLADSLTAGVNWWQARGMNVKLSLLQNLIDLAAKSMSFSKSFTFRPWHRLWVLLRPVTVSVCLTLIVIANPQWRHVDVISITRSVMWQVADDIVNADMWHCNWPAITWYNLFNWRQQRTLFLLRSLTDGGGHRLTCRCGLIEVNFADDDARSQWHEAHCLRPLSSLACPVSDFMTFSGHGKLCAGAWVFCDHAVA